MSAPAPKDYAALKIPALAVYAIEDPDEPPPARYDRNDAELMATLAEIAGLKRALQLSRFEEPTTLQRPSTTRVLA